MNWENTMLSFDAGEQVTYARELSLFLCKY